MAVTIRIDNRVRVPARDLPKDLVASLKSAFEHPNPHRESLRKMGIPVWNEPRVLRTWGESPDELTFARGGLSRVVEIMSMAGLDVAVRDMREAGMPASLPDTKRELYPYQQRVVNVAIEREQCLVRAPTGSGKTTALLALASEIGVTTLVVVPNRGLLVQWYERAVAELGMSADDIGIVKGGRGELRPLTIAIQQSVAKIAARDAKFREYFGALLFDEVHQAAAATCFAAVDAMPARYRIGVSADVKRKDRKEPLMHDLFGDVAVDVDRDDLIRSGHVLDVEVRAVPTAFAAPWYGMRDENDSTDTREIDFMRLVREMSDDPARNDQIVRIALEEVRAGHQVLVMAHLREHCMRLGQLINAGGARCGYLIGGDDSAAEFASTAAGLKNGTMRVGVGTYKAVGMGLDLPQVSVGIAATPIAANRQFFGQVRGRICRTSKGKTVARLYVLLDANVFPRHVKNMAAWNSTVMVLERDGSWVSARQ